MKTVFLGTPNVAVPFLELVNKKTELKAVITKQDAVSGRGQKLMQSPVKAKAAELGIDVLTPAKSLDAADQLKAIAPEAGIVVAYGQLLKPQFLETAKHGYLNVHFSLLPKYRGAAPVQRSLMKGEDRSGVTIFWIDKGMDTGDIFAQKEIPVLMQDNAKTLMDKLIAAGLELLAKVIDDMDNGVFTRIPQTGAPSLAGMLKKEEAFLNFNEDAVKITNLIRGLALGPYARAYLEINGQKNLLQILEARPAVFGCGERDYPPGVVLRFEKGAGFTVKCDKSALLITKVKPEGKNAMNAYDFALGAKIMPGQKFISEEL